MNSNQKLMILSLSIVLLIGAASAGVFEFGTTTPTGAVQGAFAANADGDIALTIAAAVQTDVFDADTDADDSDGMGVSADQETEIDAQAGFTASGASSDDGNTATTANLVHDGTIDTEQEAYAGFAATADQDSTLKAEQVLVCSSSEDQSGATASTVTHLEDTEAAGVEVPGSFSGTSGASASYNNPVGTAEASQEAIVLGEDIEANTCSDNGQGDTIAIEDEVDLGAGLIYQDATANPDNTVWGNQVVDMISSGEAEYEITMVSDGTEIEAEIELEGTVNGVTAEQWADDIGGTPWAWQQGAFATDGEAEIGVEVEGTTPDGYDAETGLEVTEGAGEFYQYVMDYGPAGTYAFQDSGFAGSSGVAYTEGSNPSGENAYTEATGTGVTLIETYQYVDTYPDAVYVYQDASIDVEGTGSASSFAENREGMDFNAYSSVTDGTIAVTQYGSADWPSQASGYQDTVIVGVEGYASTGVSDADGFAAETYSSVSDGDIDAYQQANVGDNPWGYEAEASQETVISGLVGEAGTDAIDDDGNLARTTSTVAVGTIVADQLAESESGFFGDVEAYQTTLIGGLDPQTVALAGTATTHAEDEDGNVVETTSWVGVGTVDAWQSAEVEGGGWWADVEAMQSTDIAGVLGGASTTATDEDGNTASVVSDVAVGTIDAFQRSEVEGGFFGDVEAFQSTYIEGVLGTAIARSVDEDGNVAEVGTGVGLGWLDVGQFTEVEGGFFGDVEAGQWGDLEGAVGTTWGTSENIYGDTSYTNANVLDLEAIPDGYIDFSNSVETNDWETSAEQDVYIYGGAGSASADSTNGKWPYNYAEVSAGFATLVPDRDGQLWATQSTETDVDGTPYWAISYNAAADQEVTILFDWNNAIPVLPEAVGYTHTEAGNGLFREVSVDSTIAKIWIPFVAPNGPTQMTTTSSAYGGNWIATVDETGARQVYYNPLGPQPLAWYNVGTGTTTASATNFWGTTTDISLNPVIDADAWATAWFRNANAV
jgi:hypothetical protein